MDVVSREWLLSEYDRQHIGPPGGARKIIEAAPSVVRKSAEWIYGEDRSGQDGWTCSGCGFFIPWYYDYYGLDNIDFIRDFHTCPHCDAKMVSYTGKNEEATE